MATHRNNDRLRDWIDLVEPCNDAVNGDWGAAERRLRELLGR